MRTLDDIRDRLRDKLPTLRERYAMEQLGVCGSFVRGDQTDESDVDLLVTFSETPDLLEFVNLKRHLDPSLRERYSDVPWDDMAGMRDVLIHKYFEVELEVV
jgi:predicted nucleotidyltransferase